jgi:predicted amidohydrolase
MMPSLSVTLIQTALFWEDKAANLRMFEEKIRAIENRMELVVLPEMFSTGFSMEPQKLAETMEGDTVNWMKEVAAENKIILTGSVIIEAEGKYYNRLIWMQPDGVYGYYDKRHLFAFAGEDQFYAPGAKRLITSVKGWKVNLQVCYDLRFPVWARQSPHEEGEAEYDLLLYVANWPERRNRAWKTLLCARAIENQCYVVGVNRVGNDNNGLNYCGDSMVIDPMGEVLYHKANEEDIFTIILEKEKLADTRKKLPFLKDGDGFHIL